MADNTVAGRVALVTGANRGIGRAITRALLARGARKVYAGARDPASLADLTAEYGNRVVELRLDITDPAQVDAAVTIAADLDLLINNAGVAESGGAQFADPKQLTAGRREMAVNVEGTYRMTLAFAPTLARNGGGTVVNVVSIAALVNFPGFESYSLSKAALHSLTQATRLQLKPRGTLVLGVYPGPVDTDMAAGAAFDTASPDDVAHEILDGVEAGVEELLPDQFARHLGGIFFRDPKALEQLVAGMASAA